MVKHTRRHRGGGVQTPQQFFNPTAYAPAAGLFNTVPTTAPNAYEIRPVLQSTFAGGRRGKQTRRRAHGGFSPSVMGSFVANAQAAIVPMALYAVYHTLVPKNPKNPKNKKASGGKTRRLRRG